MLTLVCVFTRNMLVSVPDPNQPQRGSLSACYTASDTCAGLKVWERD